MGMSFLELTGFVPDEPLHRRQIDARIAAKTRGRLLLTVVELVHLGPFRPGIVGGAFGRGLGQNFDLHQTLAAVAHRRADTVRAGVAAADDDDVLALGIDRGGGAIDFLSPAFVKCAG